MFIMLKIGSESPISLQILRKLKKKKLKNTSRVEVKVLLQVFSMITGQYFTYLGSIVMTYNGNCTLSADCERKTNGLDERDISIFF